MSAQVTFKHCDTYSRGVVYQKIKDTLSKLGGIEKFVSKGQKVLIKPNILIGKDPDRAITTHPNFLWAVIKIVQDEGGIVYVGDSSGYGSGKKAAKDCSLLDVIDEMGAKWVEFKNPVSIPGIKDGIFKNFTVDKQIPEMDVIINLPKLKTHFLMYLTMSVKNLYGCLIGPQKTHWKLHSMHNIDLFSQMLVELSEAISPSLTIVDGIVGMEGTGPTHGTPKPFNIIAAGTNPTAVDRILADILQVNPDEIPTLKAAKSMKTGVWDTDDIDTGDRIIKHYVIDSFIKPEMNIKNIGLFYRLLYKFFKKSLTLTLKIDQNSCNSCGICYNDCPMGAVIMETTNGSTDKKLQIEHQKCIGCTHCQEICPQGAIIPKEGWLSSYFHSLF